MPKKKKGQAGTTLMYCSCQVCHCNECGRINFNNKSLYTESHLTEGEGPIVPGWQTLWCLLRQTIFEDQHKIKHIQGDLFNVRHL